VALIRRSFIVLILTLAPAQGAQGSGPCAITEAPNLDVTLKDLSGKPVSLSAYRGKVLVINFWATWCVPCRTEIPGFIDLYNRYRQSGLEIVGIAVDEPASIVGPYAREIEINYPVLLEGGRHEVHEAYGLVGLPTTIIINRDGTRCEQHVGFTRRSTFEEAIKRLL
jgi:peroxiredoxin